jgi:membrane-bound lytic murein transglycosylase B
MTDPTARQRARRQRRHLGSALPVALFCACLILASGAFARPAHADFDAFVRSLWPQAAARGVSRAMFVRAFQGVTPDPSVVAKLHAQPEFQQTTEQYLAKRVSDLRVAKGRAMAVQWAPTLTAIERVFGVDRRIVLSIWGNESNFGGYLGGHSVIRALATLAYEGPRRGYFRSELLSALIILQGGNTVPEAMVGSWAGAMGHPQFMPSNFYRDAVDFTGDGRRDIWNSVPDALASIANFLKNRGWQPGQTWGYEVTLPAGFDFARARRLGTAHIATWERLGIRRVRGQRFPRPGDRAALFLPAGGHGPAFLTLHNFQVLKRYNNSSNYALAVGYLADRIAGGQPFATPWPPEQALTRTQRIEMQQRLIAAGLLDGPADGIIGAKTQAAIHAYQQRHRLMADGHPSVALLRAMR